MMFPNMGRVERSFHQLSAIAFCSELLYLGQTKLLGLALGPFDFIFHFIALLAPAAYVGSVMFLSFALAEWLSARVQGYLSRESCAVALLVLLAGQIAYSVFATPRDGASLYQPMFPSFIGGGIVAVFMAAVVSRHAKTKIGWFIYFTMVSLWMMGPVIVDGLWLAGRSSVGTEVLWTAPVVGPMIRGWTHASLVGGMISFLPASPMYMYSTTSGNLGYIAEFTIWCILLAIPPIIVVWKCYLNDSITRLEQSCLVLSMTVLGWQFCNWSGFIYD